ncbi:hypothetical protein Tco_0519160 [Tanacetum coccineum]
MIVGIEESRHEPSDAIHNPSQPFEFLSKETCLICHTLPSIRVFSQQADLSHLSPRRLPRYLSNISLEMFDMNRMEILPESASNSSANDSTIDSLLLVLSALRRS